MKLLTKELRRRIPRLYATEHDADPTVQAKFFTPDSNWTWYVLEFDGDVTFFGYVVGLDNELGYFSLRELLSARGPFGLSIVRDLYFEPQPLSVVRAIHE